MMFTDYYAENSCTAGRSTFITGQAPLRTGLSKVGLPGVAVGLQKVDITIAQAIKPLGFLLARLPVGPDHPDVTAGANFQLPYRASFLLPHRRSAWMRFAERLDELAHFAAGLHPLGGEDVTATVSGALGGTASSLMSHVEAV